MALKFWFFLFVHNIEFRNLYFSCIFFQLTEVVKKQSFKCDDCEKVCKTKGGMRRHRTIKHAEIVALEKEEAEKQERADAAKKLHPLDIRKCIKEAKAALLNDDCYPKEFRNGLNSFQIELNDGDFGVFDIMLNDILKFKGDREQFLENFKTKIIKSEPDILPKLKAQFTDTRLCTLFLFELGSRCLACLVKPPSNVVEVIKPLTEREIMALQCLSGHVYSKIYKKLRLSKHWQEDAFQMMLSILRAFKIDPTDEYRFVKARDRGGMWYVRKEAVELFKEVEMVFRQATKSHVVNINYPVLLTTCLKNMKIRSWYDIVLRCQEFKPDKELAIDLLEKLIGLYLRIRAHSYAKNIKEKHKFANKASNKHSLRNELEKLEKETERNDH